MSKNFITKDSGQRQEFSTGSRRDLPDGKGRFDLIPTSALRRLAGLYERGAKKYGDRNWEKGQPLMRYVDSLLRHANCLLAGEPDEDHAAAIAWNAFGFMHTLELIEAGRLPKELDDRPPAEPQYTKPAAEETDGPESDEDSDAKLLAIWKKGGCPACMSHERGEGYYVHNRCLENTDRRDRVFDVVDRAASSGELS